MYGPVDLLGNICAFVDMELVFALKLLQLQLYIAKAVDVLDSIK